MSKKRFARHTRIEISISGKNVTKDLAPYLTSFGFNDKTNNEVDDITLSLDNRDELFMNEWLPGRGDIIECSIVTLGFTDDNDEDTYYCGQFEIDEVGLKGPPGVIEIKAVSTFNSSIRKQLYTKAWENITVRAICQQIANKHGLTLKFHTTDDIENMPVSRIDQSEQSDLAFLAQLADDYGCKVKVYDGELTFYEESRLLLEQEVSCNISRFEIADYDMKATAYDLYKECKLTYFDPKAKVKKSVSVNHKELTFNKEWQQLKGKLGLGKGKSSPKPSQHYSTYTYLDQANATGGGKTLHLRRKFVNNKQALAICKQALMEKNKGEWVADFTCFSNVIMAGIIVYLTDFGQFSGAYLIDHASHTVNKSSGYQVKVSAHRLLGKTSDAAKK